jgi:hypothetical protein
LLNNGDTGLLYLDHAAGTGRKNESNGNGHYGICVSGQAHPILEENVCEQNMWSGLAYFEEASGKAELNRCKANGKRGIYVGEGAHPALTNNDFDANKPRSRLGRSCFPSR